jgi:hypothetical protein
VRLIAVAVFVLTMAVVSLTAHHSITAVYDSSRQVRVEGTIARFRFVNPHPYVELTAQGAGGVAQGWHLEMDNRVELAGVGMTADTLQPGDRVVVTGSASRTEARAMYVRTLVRPADGFTYEQVGTSPRITRRK